MTETEYNERPGIRRSDLWRMHESPEKYLYAVTHPEEPTPALVFGSMAHKLLLEPAGFEDEYAVAPEVDRRTKDGRAEWQRFMEENAGKVGISRSEFDQARDMALAVRRHPLAGKLVLGQAETPIFWTDAVTGEQCKCRLDLIAKVGGRWAIIDYKTAASAQTEAFNSAVFKHGYHLQAYMYTEALMREKGLAERPDFIFIVQEKKPPYSVNVIRVSDEVMDEGGRVFRQLMDALHECMETDFWPGYNGAFDEMNETFLPGYLQMGDDEG